MANTALEMLNIFQDIPQVGRVAFGVEWRIVAGSNILECIFHIIVFGSKNY